MFIIPIFNVTLFLIITLRSEILASDWPAAKFQGLLFSANNRAKLITDAAHHFDRISLILHKIYYKLIHLSLITHVRLYLQMIKFMWVRGI